MEPSEKLSRELKEIQSQIELAKNRRVELISNPEIQSTVLSMIVAQNVLEPNDPATLKLQAEVSEIKKKLYAEERGLAERLKSLSMELQSVIHPARERAIKRLNDEFRDLPKMSEEFVRHSSSRGIEMQQNIIILTNRQSLSKARKLLQDGMESVKKMETVKTIGEVVDGIIGRLEEIDFSPREVEMNLFDFKRLQFISSPPTAQI
jgi:hypothetical protein